MSDSARRLCQRAKMSFSRGAELNSPELSSSLKRTVRAMPLRILTTSLAARRCFQLALCGTMTPLFRGFLDSVPADITLLFSNTRARDLRPWLAPQARLAPVARCHAHRLV